MDITAGVALTLAIPQGIVAVVQLFQLSTGAPMPSRAKQIGFAILLVSGTATAACFGGWLWAHPLKPVVLEKTVVVEKQVPCPPTKSGNASTRGASSPAISGSGNGLNIGVQPPDKAKSK
jgi:hypothetical protein